MSFRTYWESLPDWLRQVTIFVFPPASAGFTFLTLTGEGLRRTGLTLTLFGVCFAIAAIHTGLTWWRSWRDGF